MMPKPVAHYTFDEATPYDHSGNGNTGTKNGGVTTGANGVLGTSCYDFDGTDDYVLADNVSGVGQGTNCTLVAWVKPSGGDIALEHVNGSSDRLSIQLTSGGLGIAKYDGSWTDASKSYTADGSWHHVVGVNNTSAGTLTAYVDGEPYTSSNGMSAGSPDAGLSVGGNTGGGNLFDGLIDDPRIYDYALSPAEVARLYETSKEGHLRTARKVS